MLIKPISYVLKNIRQNGRKFYSTVFIAYYLKSSTSKIHVTIRKKIGKANIRNKIRRRIKESMKVNHILGYEMWVIVNQTTCYDYSIINDSVLHLKKLTNIHNI